MLENGAPPDTFGVLYRLLHIEYHIWFLVLTQFFSDGIAPCIIRGIWEHYANTLCTLRHYTDKNNTIKLTVCVACPL